MTTPRILVVAPGFPHPSETFVCDHLEGLARHGWEVCFGTWKYEAKRSELAQRFPFVRSFVDLPDIPEWARHRRLLRAGAGALLSLRVDRKGIAQGRRRRAALMTPALERTLREIRPDVVHAHFGTAAIAIGAACRRTGTPLVVDIHGFDATSLVVAEGWGAYRALAEHATFVAHSRFIEEIVRTNATATIARVPIGVDTRRFHRPRPAAGWPDALRLIAVGRMIPPKGHADAIEVLHRLRRTPRGKGATLTLIGDGPERERLVGRARALAIEDAVTFTGNLPYDSIPARMRASDVLLVPSKRGDDGWEEAFCRVAIEGLAAGLLVLGYPSGGLVETLGSGGTVALGPYAEAMFDTLLHCLERESPGEIWDRATARAAEFAIEAMWSGYHEVATACAQGLRATRA